MTLGSTLGSQPRVTSAANKGRAIVSVAKAATAHKRCKREITVSGNYGNYSSRHARKVTFFRHFWLVLGARPPVNSI